MKQQLISVTLLTLLLTFPFSLNAQEDRNDNLTQMLDEGWEYEIKAGFNIGGVSPIPLPQEIRTIDSYNPGMGGVIVGQATKWLGAARKWGLSVSLRLENKNMNTTAGVKNYSMEIFGDGGEKIKGYWTGKVKTKVRNSYASIPIQVAYRIDKRWQLRFGPYISYLVEGDFSGDVYEGYLRETDPTGDKVSFNEGKTAKYDFSTDLRRFQWGLQLGGEWRAFKHFNVAADLTWGLNNAFKSSFKTITFNMYPIYLNIGFGYLF